MKHVNDIRALYEEKLERVNNLYAEVASLKAILEEQARNKPKYKTFYYFRWLIQINSIQFMQEGKDT